MTVTSPEFPRSGDASEIEAGLSFQPKFDTSGLIPAVAVDAVSGEVLMFAWMNATALSKSIETEIAHFWSRSRNKLWKKGEESGNILRVVEMLIDCDQDALVLRVKVEGDGVACHTGAGSCFYRRVPLGAAPLAGQPVRLTRIK